MRVGNVTVSVLCVLTLLRGALGKCPNQCSGHGECNSGGLTECDCWSQWGGADCSLRLCPAGIAWADEATATDVAHAERTECSNKGICDYNTGKCQCEEGYEGLACQRMSCRSDCLFRGRCVSMRRHALDFRHTTNPAFYSVPWDADLIHGCECDPAYEGHDCSLRKCPRGDDPLTHDQVNEIQYLTCQATAGFFILSLENRPSARIAFDATAEEMKTALFVTADVVDIQMVDGVPCDADGAVTRIEFLQRFGDVPALTIYTDWATNLDCSAGAGCDDGSGGVTADIVIHEASFTHDTIVYTPVTGTKEWEYCSNRGRCNQDTGLCECYTGYYSSDGYHNEGTLGDCGAPLDPITSCPGTPLECSGHGVCSDFPQYRCTCNSGWMGGDCSERICPFGTNWFDLPSDATFGSDVAHFDGECSNKGICDRRSGKCHCEDGFAGEACERMRCPHVGEEDECSGHGRCMSMAQLAENTDLNGDATDYYYGRETHRNITWDHHSVYGCKCDPDYHGYDCSLRTCPTGDDPNSDTPTSGQEFDEEQTIQCTGSAGYFVLSFRQDFTAHIAFDATDTDVKTILENLDTIGTVLVSTDTGTGTPICDAAAPTTTITFFSELGDVPNLIVEEDAITGGSGPVITESQKGTKQNDVCSNRGVCNEQTGVCQCFTQWGSSDGHNNPGDRADCGYRLPFIPIEQAQVDYQWWKTRNHQILLRDSAGATDDDQFVH